MGVLRSGATATVTLALAAGALALFGFGVGPLPGAAQPAGRGSIRGRVSAPGPSQPGALKVTTDEKICGPSVADETVVTDKAGNVAWAVVTVKGLAWSGAPTGPRVLNKGCRFAPHVLVARPGSTLEVDSEDQTLHTTHLYAADGRSLFNIALPMPGITIRRPLERNTGVLKLACDTHPWMRGFLAVSPDRGAVSGLDGVFQIDEVPAGSHQVSVWHESLRASTQTVTVTAGQATEVNFSLAAR